VNEVGAAQTPPKETSTLRAVVLRSIRRRSRKSRNRRWTLIRSRIDWDNIRTVLDLGGTPRFWKESGLTHLSLHVTCLNLAGEPCREQFGNLIVSRETADATRPPYDPRDFDLVFSNSVIEHVGDSAAVARFAKVARQGRRYFVQTPNRFFLVEPHFILPLHFLMPRWMKAGIVTFWDRGPRRRSYAQAQQRVDSIHLMTRREVVALFPDADVVDERKWLQRKSFMAFGPIQPANGR
jgi:hypothetical protein